jgi:hypothetical protein
MEMTAAERDMQERELWKIGDLPDMPEPDESGAIPPAFVPDDSIAEDTLRWLAYWYAERELVQTMAARERLRIDTLERAQLERIERRIAWHEGGLRAFLAALGKRAWKGLRGSVSLRAGRERVEVADETAFYSWAVQQPVDTYNTLVKTTPSKSGIAAWIKGEGAGEVPPGVELVRGDDTLAVKVAD